MKRISGINDPIKNLEGVDYQDANKEPLTFKKLVLNMVSMTKLNDGEKAIKVLAIGVNLQNSKDVFEFEKADESTLKEIINTNGIQLFAPVQAVLYDAVKHSEAYKK